MESKTILSPARVFKTFIFVALVGLLDLLLGFGVDLDAFTEEHGVHAGPGVGPGVVEQQVGQLWGQNTHFNT